MSFKSPLKEFAPRSYYKGSSNGTNVISYKRALKGRKVVWGSVFFIVSMIGVTTYLGYLVFKGKGEGFTGQRVKIEIQAPGEVKRGEESEFTIAYKNGEDVDIEDATISIFSSGSFKPVKAYPPASSASLKVWRIGNLASGQDGKVDLTGLYSKDALEREFIEATIQYNPKNMSSKFSAKSRKDIVLSGESLELKITGPENVIQGSSAEFNIEYFNKGQDLKDGELRVFVPDFFGELVFEPVPARAKTWNLNLGPGEQGLIKVKAKILDVSSDKTHEQVLRAVVSRNDSKAKPDISEAELKINSAKPFLTSSVSGSSIRDIALSYANLSEVSFDNVTAVIKVDEDQDVDYFLDSSGKKEVEGSTVFWDIGRIEPHGKGELKFSIMPVKNSKSKTFHLTPRISGKVRFQDAPVVFSGDRVEVR